MATLHPFLPLRYNPERVSDLGAVVAPPYDVISEEKRAALLARDPHNVIRLILPEGNDAEKYIHAGELFREWIESGLLISEERAGFFPYTQTFRNPASGEEMTRLGFITALEVVPFEDRVVLPHERTLSGPKADRLSLMKETDANLEAIFGIYRDRDESSRKLLETLTAAEPPLIDAVDIDGVRHRLWRATAAESIEQVRQALADEVVFIVDGHHRYETALNYRRFRREQQPDAPAGSPFDSIMIFLTPTSDPGLLILPTHRVIHSIEGFDFHSLTNRLGRHFDLHPALTVADGVARMRSENRPGSLLLLSQGEAILATPRDIEELAASLPESIAQPLRRLDVTILHEYLLEELLGITKEAQAEQTNLRYLKSDDEAIAAAEAGSAQLVVMMNPTRLEQVEEVAESGQVMPQKSTYFYPKLASGLLFNPLWSGEK
jgi:uncharacterized protein (DUF1015 family)